MMPNTIIYGLPTGRATKYIELPKLAGKREQASSSIQYRCSTGEGRQAEQAMLAAHFPPPVLLKCNKVNYGNTR